MSCTSVSRSRVLDLSQDWQSLLTRVRCIRLTLKGAKRRITGCLEVRREPVKAADFSDTLC